MSSSSIKIKQYHGVEYVDVACCLFGCFVLPFSWREEETGIASGSTVCNISKIYRPLKDGGQSKFGLNKF